MSNRPKILFEFSREDASYLMDLLHKDWAWRVAGYAIVEGSPTQPHDEHVRQWLKRRPSGLMNYMDSAADQQGFWEEGKGL